MFTFVKLLTKKKTQTLLFFFLFAPSVHKKGFFRFLFSVKLYSFFPLSTFIMMSDFFEACPCPYTQNLMHLTDTVGPHLDTIQTNLRRLDRTITDLSHIQAAATANTEQFSRLFYGLHVALTAAKFTEAPDAVAKTRIRQPRPVFKQDHPQTAPQTPPNKVPSPPQEPDTTVKRGPTRYRPLPPQLAVAKFSTMSRIQKPTQFTLSQPRFPSSRKLSRFFTPLKVTRPHFPE